MNESSDAGYRNKDHLPSTIGVDYLCNGRNNRVSRLFNGCNVQSGCVCVGRISRIYLADLWKDAIHHMAYLILLVSLWA